MFCTCITREMMPLAVITALCWSPNELLLVCSLSGFQVTCSAVWHSLGGRNAASAMHHFSCWHTEKHPRFLSLAHTASHTSSQNGGHITTLWSLYAKQVWNITDCWHKTVNSVVNSAALWSDAHMAKTSLGHPLFQVSDHLFAHYYLTFLSNQIVFIQT